MIELFISSKIKSHLNLKQRVKGNHIALKILDDYNIENSMLIEGNKTYRGIVAVNAFLDDFELLIQKWHTPICDDYDFD